MQKKTNKLSQETKVKKNSFSVNLGNLIENEKDKTNTFSIIQK